MKGSFVLTRFRSIVPLAFICMFLVAPPALSQVQRVAVVNASRVLKESDVAKRAQTRIESQFAVRKGDLQAQADVVKYLNERFEKDSPTLSDIDRQRRRTELISKRRDLEKQRNAFNEDRSSVRRADAQRIIELAKKVVEQVARAENFDIVVQEAVFVNPAYDITDKVISGMNAEADH